MDLKYSTSGSNYPYNISDEKREGYIALSADLSKWYDTLDYAERRMRYWLHRNPIFLLKSNINVWNIHRATGSVEMESLWRDRYGGFNRPREGSGFSAGRKKTHEKITALEIVQEAEKYYRQTATPVVNESSRETVKCEYPYSAADSTGVCSVSAVTYENSIASCSNNYSVAVATSDSSIAKTAGSFSTAVASDMYSIAVAEGSRSAAIINNEKSVAITTANESVAVATGRCSLATSAKRSVAVTSNSYSKSVSKGGNRRDEESVSMVTGLSSVAVAEGSKDIACAFGSYSYAKGALGSWLVLRDHFSDNIKAVKVDGEKIKADTLYWLNHDFVCETTESMEYILKPK
jgi:hypothetical protein